MKNFKYHGQNMSFIAAADFVSGDVVVIGELVGICSYDVLSGGEGEMSVTGIYELPKQAALAVAHGEKAYWDGSEVDNAAGDDGQNTEIGVFSKAAGSADSVAQVLLKGGSRAFN